MKLSAFFISLSLLFCAELFSQVTKRDTFWQNRRIYSISVYNGVDSQVTFYNYNGNRSMEYNFKNRIKDGFQRTYFENDQVNSEKLYKEGQLLYSKEWHRSGQLKLIENYKSFDEPPISYLHGPTTRYYVDGTVEYQGQYEKGKKTGEWVGYYQNKQKSYIKNYKNNLMFGKCKEWYESGILKSTGNYIIDSADNRGYKKTRELVSKPHGKIVYYYVNGNKKSEINYKNGKMNGSYTTWFESGKLHEKAEYSMDVLSGVSKRWFENGLMEFEKHYGKPEMKNGYYRAVLNGPYIEYYKEGVLKLKGSFLNDKKEGWFEEYYNDGKLKSKNLYKNGMELSTTYYNYKTGQLLSQYYFEIDPKSGRSVLHGLSLNYNENGILRDSGSYYMGVRDGLWVSRLENGQLTSIIEYCKGKYCGIRKEWYYNGVLKYDAYKLNPLPGTTEIFYLQNNYAESGHLSSTTISDENNKVLYAKTYWQDGQIKDEKMYVPLVNKNSYNLSTDNFRIEYHYYPNGNPETFFVQTDNGYVGRKIDYYINGHLKSVKDFELQSYKSALELYWASDGTWIQSLSDTIPLSEVRTIYETYKNSKLVGLCDTIMDNGSWYKIYQLEKGKVLMKADYLGNILLGNVEVFHYNGRLAVQLIKAKADGMDTLRYYAANGKLIRTETSRNGVKVGVYATWNPITHVPSGWQLYSDSGILIENKYYEYGRLQYHHRYLNYKGPNYSNFLQHGKQESFHPNGQLRNVYYTDSGKTYGWAYIYYPNGRMESQSYFIKGNQDSLETKWDSFGNIKMIRHYKKGKAEGLSQTYWPNGKIEHKGYFKNNKYDSTWVEFDSLGNELRIREYVNGRLVMTQGISACFCNDTFKKEFSFLNMLNQHATLERVREWSFRFHQPLPEFYDHLFYKNFQSSGNQNSQYYNFDIVTYNIMKIGVTTSNRLNLIFNPCRRLGNTYKPINCTLNIHNQDKSKTRLELETDVMALEFNSSLIREALTGQDSLSGLIAPTIVYFKSKQLSYNSQDLIDVSSGYQAMCFPWSVLGNTGMRIKTDLFNIDLNPEKNPYDYNYSYRYYYEERQSKGSDNFRYKGFMDEFVGLTADSFNLVLPKSVLSTNKDLFLAGKNLMIGEYRVIGSFALNVKLGVGLQYELANDNKVKFSPSLIESNMKALGFKEITTKYLPETSQLIVYFNYSVN
jgi:antitoxin component YwqK of YwqJK toxin-antitoxin module